MRTIKSMLKKESCQLKQIVSECEIRLKNAPKGNLRIAKKKNRFDYYYVNEEENTYMLSDSFNVPYSKTGSLFSYEEHFVVNLPDENCVNEYDKEGRMIRGLEYGNQNKPAKVLKHNMKNFWYR